MIFIATYIGKENYSRTVSADSLEDARYTARKWTKKGYILATLTQQLGKE